MDSILRAAAWLFAAVTMAYGAEEPIVRRADFIAVVRVVSAKPGGWRQAPRLTKTRSVELHVRVLRVLKGGGKPGELTLQVSQSEPSGPMSVAVPGVWSGKSIGASAEYVVFGRGGTLSEAETLGVSPAREALADTELAIRSDANGWPLVQSLEQRGQQPGPVFIEYAVARLPEILFSDFEQFDRVTGLLEKGALNGSLREALLEAIFSRFLQADPAPSRFVGRLAAGSLRMIMGADAALRERLLETLLPNLIGLDGGVTKKAASEVLKDYPADADRARNFLRGAPGGGAARVLAWLR